ncbi:hypothetical protein KP77_04260 [Jeotgalibacillus alimentarius]|uniref:DUF1835 domain-containing protein n=1 Tax=Jeotgalibacillus alimentarius TaxID=135826 RepID=A0A0C2RT87_9BACL|nr:DUF1835 domain-containing protein [Jeotgalibacillus alimentarius]KIL53450.1 hypothetical protein KP77_04260 [Jeotgalibacillus alimentarius]
MMDDLKDLIERLSEEDAKRILLQTVVRIQTIQGVEEKEKMIQELYRWQQQVLRSAGSRHLERPYQAVHLVCGESPAGSLKVGLDRNQKVIGFPDFFAEGPISHLDQDSGQKQRVEWLRNHMNGQDDYFEKEYEKRFANALKEIAAIPEDIPIIVWSGENADEQTGIRFFLYLIREKENAIFLINSISAFQELYPTETVQEFYSHTGGIEPEKLKKIYLEKALQPLTTFERRCYEQEWESLSSMDGTLRIWKDQQIHFVNEGYYDSFILTAADVTNDQDDGFVRVARLVGEAMVQIDDVISDMFLEYRVRTLLYSGVFEIKGIPKSMRHYSVKKKEDKTL